VCISVELGRLRLPW